RGARGDAEPFPGIVADAAVSEPQRAIADPERQEALADGDVERSAAASKRVSRRSTWTAASWHRSPRRREDGNSSAHASAAMASRSEAASVGRTSLMLHR